MPPAEQLWPQDLGDLSTPATSSLNVAYMAPLTDDFDSTANGLDWVSTPLA